MKSAPLKTIDAKSISFKKPPIAFFCAEYALDDESLSYAGGLGVLAGDMLYESADEGVPLAAIGLWYAGSAAGVSADAYPLLIRDGSPLVIEIPWEKGSIQAHVRARRFGESVWLFLLDTDIEGNDAESRRILSRIYDMDQNIRIQQDLVLGIGGVKLLDALNIAPRVHHLNEGHAAFAAFELVLRSVSAGASKSVALAVKNVRDRVVATKHTILSEAGAKIAPRDFERFFGPYINALGVSEKDIFSLGTNPDSNVFSTTHFLLNTAKRQNAVSVLHAQFEKEVHPKSALIPVTNGVYKKRWQAKGFAAGTSRSLDKDIWKAKGVLRKELIDYVNSKTGSSLDPSVCTVVWARRFVSYKRPELLFSDLKRLERITSGDRRLQFIISGKVYHSDSLAQETLDRIKALANDPAWRGRIAYVPDYSVSVTHRLVCGADVWLNTPLRGKEACGTSGMKAGLNGALQMSISDGWVAEADWKDAGWILPEEDTASAIYDMLEREVAPLFYDRSKDAVSGAWVERMRKTMSIVEKDFTAQRMLRDYIKKLY